MRSRWFDGLSRSVSEIGFGAWAIGADWGDVSDDDARATVAAAYDSGVTFFDTADVYGDGRSERFIGELKAAHPEVVVATKAGRRLDPHVADGYNERNLNDFVDRSREYLGMDTLDLVQLHCPPTDVYYRPHVFEALDRMVAAGKIARYGVSVEKIEEGLKAINYPGVASVQIIFNMLRQRPAELFLEEADDKGVAVIVRVPLASGLLSGKYDASSQFAASDHRNYNRAGAAFDVGETFSGIPYEAGLSAIDEIRPLVPEGWSMAQMALRWILQFEQVTTVIPGAKNPAQALANASASTLSSLSPETMESVADIYTRHAAPHVHHKW